MSAFRMFTAPARQGVTGGTGDPLDQLPPRDEPAYFGVKVEVDGAQYGFVIDEEDLAMAGLQIIATDKVVVDIESRGLVEGSSPGFSEVKVA